MNSVDNQTNKPKMIKLLMVDIGKKEKLKSVIDDTKTNFQLFFSLVLSFSSKFGHHMNQSLRE